MAIVVWVVPGLCLPILLRSKLRCPSDSVYLLLYSGLLPDYFVQSRDIKTNSVCSCGILRVRIAGGVAQVSTHVVSRQLNGMPG